MQKQTFTDKKPNVTKKFNFDTLKFKKAHKNKVLSFQASELNKVIKKKTKGNVLFFSKEMSQYQKE